MHKMLEKSKILTFARLTCYRRQPGDAGVALLPLRNTKLGYFPLKAFCFLLLMYIFTFFPSLYLTAPSMTGVRSPIFFLGLLDLEEHKQSSLFFSHGLISSVTSWAKKVQKCRKSIKKLWKTLSGSTHFSGGSEECAAPGDAAAAQN